MNHHSHRITKIWFLVNICEIASRLPVIIRLTNKVEQIKAWAIFPENINENDNITYLLHVYNTFLDTCHWKVDSFKSCNRGNLVTFLINGRGYRDLKNRQLTYNKKPIFFQTRYNEVDSPSRFLSTLIIFLSQIAHGYYNLRTFLLKLFGFVRQILLCF